MNIKKLILICSIIIIIIVVALISINNIPRQKEQSVDKGKVEVSNQKEDINEISMAEFFRIDECIKKYLNVTNIKSSLYYGKQGLNGYGQLVEDDFIREKAIDLLDQEYVLKNKIDKNNVEEFIKFSNVERNYIITDIKKKNKENPSQFLVSGYISQNNTIKEFQNYFIVLDSKNGIFSIKPLEDDDKNKNFEIKEIEKNYNNKIPVVVVDAENVCRFYFNMIKNRIILEKEYFYKNLDKEYFEKRFETVEKYGDYIKKNLNEINNLNLVKYTINNKDGSNEYILVDQYDNFYTITAKTVTDYKVKLDPYTIMIEDFKKQYNSSKEQRKVLMNIDKWVRMLNNRDYQSAYRVLNEKFRQEKFATEEKFEEIMKKAFPMHYKVEYGDFKDENGTYIQEITMEDMTGKEEKNIEMAVIMELKDEYQFEMSFSIK